MEKHQNSRSGSSGIPSRQSSSRKVRLLKAVCCAALLVLGYIVFIHHFLKDNKQLWTWRLWGDEIDSHRNASTEGSQYLLGVGKADITG